MADILGGDLKGWPIAYLGLLLRDLGIEDSRSLFWIDAEKDLLVGKRTTYHLGAESH